MSYGANEAVEDAEREHRDRCAILIAQKAAQLVAARDMGRDAAIAVVTEWLRREGEADGDVTRVMAIENELPSPSKEAPPSQVAAIASELLEAARDAAAAL